MNGNKKKCLFVCCTGAAVNLILFLIKLYIGLSSNSISIYADSLNNAADTAVCAALCLGFGLIDTQRTEKYPFGKGKTEELMSFLISAVVLFTGAAFFYISLEKVFYPVPIWYSTFYAYIIAATAAVKLALFVFFNSESKKLGSDVIKGLRTDSLLDFFITLCTLISFTLTEYTGICVDGFGGLIISAILTVEGFKSLKDSWSMIIGRRDSEKCEKAKTIFDRYTSITLYAIECHSYGTVSVYTASTDGIDSESLIKIQNDFSNELNAEIFVNCNSERNVNNEG